MDILKKLLVVTSLFVSSVVTAQVQVQFNSRNPNDINSLYRFSLQNLDLKVYEANVSLTLEDEKGKRVLIAQAPKLRVGNGTNMYDLSRSTQVSTRFSNTEAGRFARASGQLPNGSYMLCINAVLEEKDKLDSKEIEKCFPVEVLRFSELNLVYPGDGDNICEPTPNFQWRPLLPTTAGVEYSLKVVEVGSSSNGKESVNRDLPFLFIEKIRSAIYNTASAGKKFVDGRKYAWQVYAVANGVQLAASEIWEFIQGCPDSVKEDKTDAFVLLSALTNGSSITCAGDYLAVAFINPYGARHLNYSITDMEGQVKLGNLPVIKIENGLNKVQIPLEDISGIEKGHTYIVRFYDIYEQELNLKMKIK